MLRATRFEIAKILGERATQIEKGSPIFVDMCPYDTVETISRRELLEGRIPFSIQRLLPDGSTLKIAVSDLVFSAQWRNAQWGLIERLRHNNKKLLDSFE